jgi:uncharacterized coiled-coil DUF342 family protein
MEDFKAKIEAKIEAKQKEYQQFYQRLQQLEQEASSINQEMFKIAGAIDELKDLLKEGEDD